jgi:hypothetical protein
MMAGNYSTSGGNPSTSDDPAERIRGLMDSPTTGATDILAALQNLVTATNALVTKLGNIFPQATATSSTAPTVGTITFTSSQAANFLSVLTSSGGTYKVPLY